MQRKTQLQAQLGYMEHYSALKKSMIGWVLTMMAIQQLNMVRLILLQWTGQKNLLIHSKLVSMEYMFNSQLKQLKIEACLLRQSEKLLRAEFTQVKWP